MIWLCWEKKRTIFCVCVCVCTSVLLLLHPEQSAAVHKASCYPRGRQLNDLLKACLSSVTRFFWLTLMSTSCYNTVYSYDCNKRIPGIVLFFFFRSWDVIYLPQDKIGCCQLTPGRSKFATILKNDTKICLLERPKVSNIIPVSEVIRIFLLVMMSWVQCCSYVRNTVVIKLFYMCKINSYCLQFHITFTQTWL